MFEILIFAVVDSNGKKILSHARQFVCQFSTVAFDDHKNCNVFHRFPFEWCLGKVAIMIKELTVHKHRKQESSIGSIFHLIFIYLFIFNYSFS